MTIAPCITCIDAGIPHTECVCAAVQGRKSDMCPATDSAAKPLTPRLEECLNAMIVLFRSGVNITRNIMAQYMELGGTGIRYLLKKLCDAGYVERWKVGKIFYYTPLKNADGSPLMQTEIFTNADGVRVTRYPPAYAKGYGFRPSMIEEIG